MSTMALQLPSSFVDVERDEMEYVDGGNAFTNWFFSVDNVGAILNTIIGDVIPFGGIAGFVAKEGAANAARYLEGFLVNKLRAIGISVAGATIIGGIQWALNYFSPGYRLACWLDSIDACHNNGIVWF